MITDDQGLPILDQFSADGFVDCVFQVHQLQNNNEFYDFVLLASHKQKKVGFAVKLVMKIERGFDGEMNLIKDHVYPQGAIFRSLGQTSDDLMTALAELYGHEVGRLRMVPEESFTLIALETKNNDLETHAVRMKLFGRDSEPFLEEDYFESFFNVDLPNGFVYWNEKDPGYRAPLIKALGGG